MSLVRHLIKPCKKKDRRKKSVHPCEFLTLLFIPYIDITLGI